MRTRNLLSKLVLSAVLVLLLSVPVFATAPTATSFSSTASTVGATLLQLQGADTDGTALTYAIGTSPSHGTLSGLATSTGYVIYTPTSGYTGSDTFTYTVTSGGDITAPATVTLTVTNAKTRIVDILIGPGGAALTGKVTFILTQKVWSPAGLIPLSASVSGVLNGSGQFDVSVYPSSALSPTAYYQVWYESLSGRREIIGVYSIPATSASSITLSPYQVTNQALAAQYTYLSVAAMNSLATGLSGFVTTFNGRTGAISPASGDYTWAQITKTTSSFADITTRSASVIDTGTLPDGRFPSTLPALNGSLLTALNAGNLSSGTVGTARLGSGTANSSTFLRGDSTWATPSFVGGSGTTGTVPYFTASGTVGDSPWLRYGSGTMGFASGSVAVPSPSSQLTGTRVLLYPGSSGSHLGIGVATNNFWFNNGTGNNYTFYWGADTTVNHSLLATGYYAINNGSTFTFNWDTTADPSTSAMILSSGAYTVRVTPANSNTYTWDFNTTALRPFTTNSVTLGDGSHLVLKVFTKQISVDSSADGHGSLLIEGSKVGLNDGTAITWHSNSDGSGGGDVALLRRAPAVVGVTNASTGGGTFAFKPCTPTTLSANQNNYNPGCVSKYIRMDETTGVNITGLTFSTAQVDGQEHVIANIGSSGSIVLVVESASSAAANRFYHPGGNVTLAPGEMADCWYDGTVSRWRVNKRN